MRRSLVLLVLALVPSASGAQQSLLDNHVYVDFLLRPEPFGSYFLPDELKAAQNQASKSFAELLSALGLVEVRGVATEDDYPKLRVSAGCNGSAKKDCPCDVGITFQLFDAQGLRAESDPVTYALAKEQCITKVEVEPGRLAPDLSTFLRLEIVELEGFTELLKALAGLEVARKATPDVRKKPFTWLLPLTHTHRLLERSPVFVVEGSFDILQRTEDQNPRTDVPIQCTATYSGRVPADSTGATHPYGRELAGRWIVEVRDKEEDSCSPMSGLTPLTPVDASVRLDDFQQMPSKVDLLGGGE